MVKKKWGKKLGKKKAKVGKVGVKKKMTQKKYLKKKRLKKKYCLLWVKTYCGERHIPTNDVYLFLR